MYDASETGSVEEVVRRLAVWAEGTTGGIALVRYDSEFARHAAIDRFVGELDRRGVSVTVRDLTPVPSHARIDTLGRWLNEAPIHSVFVASGLVHTPANESEAREQLGPWNFARERLAVPNLAQVWWVPRLVADAFARTAPDLYSWLLLRLDLAETTSIVAPYREDEPIRFGDEAMARATVGRLEDRLQRLPEKERRGAAGLEAVSRMVYTLDGAGLHTEASGLLIRITQENGFLDVDAWVESMGQEELHQKADRLHELAIHSSAIGSFAEAKRRVQDALRIRESLEDADERDTLASMNNLAGIFEEEGNLHEARLLFERILLRGRAAFGDDDPSVLVVMNNLGKTYMGLGDFERARILYKEALSRQQSSLGRTHNNSLATMSNLASVEQRLGHLEEAESLVSEALTMSREALGERHPLSLTLLNNHAWLLLKLGHFDQATTRCEETFIARNAVLGHDHPDTLQSLSGLGVCFSAQGRYDQALPLLDAAMTMALETLGSEHPVTREIAENRQQALDSQSAAIH